MLKTIITPHGKVSFCESSKGYQEYQYPTCNRGIPCDVCMQKYNARRYANAVLEANGLRVSKREVDKS